MVTGHIRLCRTLSMILGALSLATSAQGAIVSIDLSSGFFTDGNVTVAAGGQSATLREDPLFPNEPALLSNDPSQGDPTVIVPQLGATLRLAYNFAEAAGESDLFQVTLFDLTDGAVYGAQFTSSESGDIAFDLAPLVGHVLGLEFSLSRLAGDTGVQSLASVSNVRIDKIDVEPIPEPSTYLLLGIGLVALFSFGRAARARERRVGAIVG